MTFSSCQMSQLSTKLSWRQQHFPHNILEQWSPNRRLLHWRSFPGMNGFCYSILDADEDLNYSTQGSLQWDNPRVCIPTQKWLAAKTPRGYRSGICERPRQKSRSLSPKERQGGHQIQSAGWSSVIPALEGPLHNFSWSIGLPCYKAIFNVSMMWEDESKTRQKSSHLNHCYKMRRIVIHTVFSMYQIFCFCKTLIIMI